MIYFLRLKSKSIFSVDYTNQDLKDFVQELDFFLSEEIFLTFDFSDSFNVKQAIENCTKTRIKFLKYSVFALEY